MHSIIPNENSPVSYEYYKNILKENPYYICNIKNTNLFYNKLALYSLKVYYNNIEKYKYNPHLLKFIKYQNIEICRFVIANDSETRYFKHIINKTPFLCILAVQVNPMLLKYVDYQTYNMCFRAVNGCGYLIKYVKNPTLNIYKSAIFDNGYNLKFFKEQYEEICLLAYFFDFKSIKYIDLDKIVINNYTKESMYIYMNETLKLFNKRLSISYIINEQEKFKCLLVIDNINTKESILNRIFKYILNKNPLHLKFINNKYINDELIKHAFNLNILSYKYIPKNLKNNIISYFNDYIYENMEECIICNKIKKYYVMFSCNNKHVLCLKCAINLNKCYYNCSNSVCKGDNLIINN